MNVERSSPSSTAITSVSSEEVVIIQVSGDL